jgi:hypothetical protein
MKYSGASDAAEKRSLETKWKKQKVDGRKHVLENDTLIASAPVLAINQSSALLTITKD